MRCHEEDSYQSRLAFRIFKVRRRLEMHIGVLTGLFVLFKDFRHLYYVANYPYRTREVFFHTRVIGLQNIFED